MTKYLLDEEETNTLAHNNFIVNVTSSKIISNKIDGDKQLPVSLLDYYESVERSLETSILRHWSLALCLSHIKNKESNLYLFRSFPVKVFFRKNTVLTLFVEGKETFVDILSLGIKETARDKYVELIKTLVINHYLDKFNANKLAKIVDVILYHLSEDDIDGTKKMKQRSLFG